MNDDPHIGPIAEFVFREHRLENRQRQVFRLIRFHIDVNMRTMPPRRSQQRPQPNRDALGRPFRIDRVELAVERRKFHRHVDPRNRATVVAVESRDFRPGVHRRGNGFDQIDVGLQISIGFDFAGHRFAEDVEREGPFPDSFGKGDFEHFLGRRAGDKPPGVGRRAGASRIGEHVLGRAESPRDIQSDPRRRRQPIANRPQILLQMPRHASAFAQHRQHIDEAKHLHLDGFVAHGPFHEPFVPPAALQKRRPPRVEMAEQPAADFLSRPFDAGQIGRAKINR